MSALQLPLLAEFGVGDFDTAREYYRKMIDEYRAFLAVCEEIREKRNKQGQRAVPGRYSRRGVAGRPG